LLDRNSHFAGHNARRALVRGVGGRNLPQIYVPAGKGRLPELYMRDAKARLLISRLKWFISTCIVGAAGLCIIGIAMYASTDMEDGSGMVGSLRSATLAALKPKATGNLIGDKVALPGEKTDKIKITTKGLSTRYTIQDSVVERRNSREFITVKPYIRITATLSSIKPDNGDEIPAFNPSDLYAPQKTSNAGERISEPSEKAPHNDYLTVKLVELAGGFLPEEDRQVLTEDEVERFVAEADAVYAESATQLRPGILPDGDSLSDDADATIAGAQDSEARLIRTTVLEKISDDDEPSDNKELRSLIADPGDTLIGLLTQAGAEQWQANAINDAISSGKGFKLRVGQEIRLILAPGATESSKEPTKVSIFSGVKPEGTAIRTADGDYAVSDDHIQISPNSDTDDNVVERATLYTSLYSSALAQNLDAETITTLLRTFGYDVDYKQRVRPGDGFELFFDVKQGENGAEEPGELLYVSMTVGGEAMKYYRYRTPDRVVDFYNPEGSNSRKFLMRKPMKAGRFTSGFGYRRHPLLGIKKMHMGVDWAAPTGTPIMAAGSGTVEHAGRYGGNGNFVKIRHGNGYKTSYSHLHRIASDLKKGSKIRQGQQIGTVGTTGLSTGPHLHYQVYVNDRPTNPLKIHVPRSRKLNGRLLTDFRKDMQRIEELMHRTPVKTRIAAAND
jgi:murein DD-endopeptidase MepM/ murein hydrolase activator NlpD